MGSSRLGFYHERNQRLIIGGFGWVREIIVFELERGEITMVFGGEEEGDGMK